MSNETPFWKETPADGEPETDHGPAAGDTDVLANRGPRAIWQSPHPDEPEIDPETGERGQWIPVQVLDKKVSKNTLKAVEMQEDKDYVGPGIMAAIGDKEGEHIGTVWIPLHSYDEDPSDDDIQEAIDALYSMRYWQILPFETDEDAPQKQPRQIALPITMNPAYRAGIAYTPTPQPWIHLVESLWQPWDVEPGTWPERYFPLNKGKGGVRFTFQENPNGATETQLAHAVELAENLNPVIPRVVTALGNLYTPNRKHRGRMIATTAEIGRDVYGRPPSKKQMEAVNDAMYTLGYLVVQQLAYQRHEKGKRKPQLQSYPARRFLSWDRLHQNGRNVTYDIQLGEPILAVLEDFVKQVAGIPEGALALDARRPAHARFATAIIMRCNLTWVTRKWDRIGLTHREILEYAGFDPDAIDPRRRPKFRESVAEILDQSQLWDHRYAPDTATSMDAMRWDQWLEEPRVLLKVRKHERPDTLEDDDSTPKSDQEAETQMHPSWQ